MFYLYGKCFRSSFNELIRFKQLTFFNLVKKIVIYTSTEGKTHVFVHLSDYGESD